MIILAAHIKESRKLNGLTQVELSGRTGVGLRFVRDLEQGKRTLRMDKVNDVLVLFGQKTRRDIISVMPRNICRTGLLIVISKNLVNFAIQPRVCWNW